MLYVYIYIYIYHSISFYIYLICTILLLSLHFLLFFFYPRLESWCRACTELPWQPRSWLPMGSIVMGDPQARWMVYFIVNPILIAG